MVDDQLSIGQFLRLIWPDTGYYCIAHPFTPKGTTKQVYAHKVFSTIGEAVTHCHEMVEVSDTFFSVLSLEKDRIEDPVKVNDWNGKPKVYTRIAENMLAARAVFWDLDVGTDPSKYDSREDALRALAEFLETSRLPIPTLVSSGGGVHVYWPFVESLPVAVWLPIAWNMRQLGEALGMKIDPTRTTDTTSVLRVPHTFNWKDRANRRPVKVLERGVGQTPVDVFRQQLQEAMIRAGVTATDAPARKTAAPVDPDLPAQVFNDFGPKLTLGEVAAACGQVREMIRSHGEPAHPFYGALDNTAWYRGMLATIRHVEDGEQWCHKLTDMHPRSVSDTAEKLLQLQPYGPARCETLQQIMPWRDNPCKNCRFFNDERTPNPLAAARKVTGALPPASEPPSPSAAPASSAAAPLSLQPVSSVAAFASLQIPNPPKPWERLKTGGIAITRKDKDNNDQTTVIYPNDLYPLKRLVNKDDATEQQVWRVVLPRTGAKDFVLDADALYDSRKFCAAIAHNGIYPNKSEISTLQDYMVAYIAQLQKTLDGESQVGHLGWIDDYRGFVLPDKTLLEDGSARTSALTASAERAAQYITKRGSLAEQVRLLGFYNHPEYIANQFVVLCSLGSVIFHATGNHGIVVNCSGEAGASKSTTLYTAASLWGDPTLWPINGTNRGATPNARAQRIATNANLPTCVDEITHLPVKEAIDLVMNITQPGHRLRLDTTGAERKQGDGYKSAIMIATANSSLHSLLSTDNAAGTAGSMRVFEMKFVAQNVHTKAEADEFLRQLRQNYGWIGEQLVQFVVRHRAAVDRRVQDVVRMIDAQANIQSSERFHSAVVAVAVVAGEIANTLGLLAYDPQAVLRWAVEQQIPYMRGVIKEEYRSPIAILTDYIAERHNNIVVVDRATAIGVNTGGQAVAGDSSFAVNHPSGGLLGHYDMKAGVLYLLKQGFKEYCSRIGASSTRIIDELSQPRARGIEAPTRIITNRQCRKTLGAGTDLAKGQSWCFSIDMQHPEISGITPLTTVSGGTPISAPVGQLKAVQ